MYNTTEIHNIEDGKGFTDKGKEVIRDLAQGAVKVIAGTNTTVIGPGGSGHHALTKTQMAKVIDAQSKEIDELKKDNADKDKRIDALEQKMTEILAKLDSSKS